MDRTVNIKLVSDTDIFLSRLHEEGFDVSSDDPALHFGAMGTFATSLAMCTFAVLASYAQRVDVGVDDLTIGMSWGYGEKPHRIKQLDMDIRWPEVPESRLDAAMRAAATCTLHRTLEHSVEVETMIS